MNPRQNIRDSYTVKAECDNCSWGGRVEIQRGVELSQVRCPNCKVVKLTHRLWLWPHQWGKKARAFRV